MCVYKVWLWVTFLMHSVDVFHCGLVTGFVLQFDTVVE